MQAEFGHDRFSFSDFNGSFSPVASRNNPGGIAAARHQVSSDSGIPPPSVGNACKAMIDGRPRDRRTATEYDGVPIIVTRDRRTAP